MRVQVYSGHGFAVFIDPQAVEAMVRAADKAHPNETTGPLFGVLTGEIGSGKATAASIMEAEVAVFEAGPTHCVFDGELASRMSEERWRSYRQIMLGEWHSHPGGSPTPSPVDIERGKKNVSSPDVKMPEEVLVIVGGLPGKRVWSVHVVTRTDVHKLDLIENR